MGELEGVIEELEPKDPLYAPKDLLTKATDDIKQAADSLPAPKDIFTRATDDIKHVADSASHTLRDAATGTATKAKSATSGLFEQAKKAAWTVEDEVKDLFLKISGSPSKTTGATGGLTTREEATQTEEEWSMEKMVQESKDAAVQAREGMGEKVRELEEKGSEALKGMAEKGRGDAEVRAQKRVDQ